MRPLYVPAVLALVLVSACTAFGEAPREDESKPAVDAVTTVPQTAAPTPSKTTTSSPTPQATQPPPSQTVACKDTLTADSCGACCVEKGSNVAAEMEAIEKEWHACVCKPSRCAAACASEVCASPERAATSSACSDCLGERASPCDDAEDNAMSALAARDDMQECIVASGCASKPPAAPGAGQH